MKTILLKPMRDLIDKHNFFHEFEKYQSVFGKVVAIQIFYFKYRELPAANIIQRLENENLRKLLLHTGGGRLEALHKLAFQELLARVAPKNGSVYHAQITELITIFDMDSYTQAMEILSAQPFD